MNEKAMVLFHRCALSFRVSSNSKIEHQIQQSYFDEELHSGDVAYKHYFDEQEQQDFPDVSIRLYTLSEIINSVITSNFNIKKFDEHLGWENENIPWEFTIVAKK
ncbi:hypothetical protein [Paenibacillus sp. P36]|uniref:hypothetical protein n=1 Tax=Paenibacillus sp. P36 TaxID=3342538 RepID=UPI0038B383BF